MRTVLGCSVDGCERAVWSRGWCTLHYHRWHRHGTTDDPRPTVVDRFWEKVDRTGDCWLWTGHVTPEGYGRFWDGTRLVGPHRWIYERQVGLIQVGLELDHRHTCPKNCVNPDHLRPATHKQNGENIAVKRISRSGVRGVWWSEERQKWCAQVCHRGKKINVGRYLTLEEAETAVIAKRLELCTHNDADRVIA